MNRQEFKQILENLTPDQRATLKLFLAGYNDEEIAQRRYGLIADRGTGKMKSSGDNVRFHIANIIDKFQLKSFPVKERRCALVRLFIQNNPLPSGWVVSPEVLDQYNIEFIQQILSPGNWLGHESAFYIEPSHILIDCQQLVKQEAALLRVKAAHKAGKTSLLKRILKYAEQEGYYFACVDFQTIDQSQLRDLRTFLQLFCNHVSNALKLESQIESAWKNNISSQEACAVYFEDYILGVLEKPLVIGLDGVDKLFDHPELYEFFVMLRSWNEKAIDSEIWKSLRLVVTYSTGIYIKLDIHNSPFNIGESIVLPQLNVEQVVILARRYGITGFNDESANHLMNMVEGDPYLIQMALYHLHKDGLDLNTLLHLAPTQQGIYKDHLGKLRSFLEAPLQGKNSVLLEALKQIIIADSYIDLPNDIGFKLEAMGLIHLNGDAGKISCELYRRHFQRCLGLKN